LLIDSPLILRPEKKEREERGGEEGEALITVSQKLHRFL
jgi:hypothetical protein